MYSSKLMITSEKDVKMNKYILKSTAQLTGAVLAIMSVSFTIAFLLEYFKPTSGQVIGGVMAVIFLAIAYNLIRIQASILETRDRLNNKQ